MSDLPDPLTPPDCDIRCFAYLPLDVVRLRDSDIAALPNAEAFRCAVMLWCASWHQVPAGSLPDDESAMARLAGYGRDLKTFRMAREGGALRGYVKCSDGRLYHHVVAEKARSAHDSKLAQRARTENARRARSGAIGAAKGRSETPPTISVRTPATGSVTDLTRTPVTEPAIGTLTKAVTASKEREGKEKEEGSELCSGASPPLLDARAKLFRDGPSIVQRLTGKPAKASRAVIGKLLKAMGDDCARLLDVLRQAEELRPIDPVAWLNAAVVARTSPKPGTMDLIRQDWNLDGMALQWHGDPDLDSEKSRLQ